MSVEKNVPEIRFEGFSGKWEQRKLNTIFNKTRNAFVGTATPYYVKEGNFYLESNNVKDGKINRKNEIFINNYFYQKQSDKWLREGDIVMVQSGHVGHTAVIPPELNNIAAHALIMFTDPKEKISPHFLNFQFQTDKVKTKLSEITTGNTIKHILSSEMKEFKVPFTSCEEQTKIGNTFQKLDNLINQHQQKHDKLSSIKKAMLERTFPKQGETIPEIRFKGFSGEWEEKPLKKVASDITDGNWIESEHIFESGEFRIIQTGNIGIGQYLDRPKHAKFFHQLNFDAVRGNEIYPGDILISRLADPAGRAAILPDTGYRMVTAVDVAIVRPEPTFNSYFLMTLFNMDQTLKAVGEWVSGTSHKRISHANLVKVGIIIPCVDEQTKIGNYFNKLDALINQHQQQITKLNNVKQACLSKMFV